MSHNRLIDIRLVSRLKTLQKVNFAHNSLDSIDRKSLNYCQSQVLYVLLSYVLFSVEDAIKLDHIEYC
jgi:hypothetical protein